MSDYLRLPDPFYSYNKDEVAYCLRRIQSLGFGFDSSRLKLPHANPDASSLSPLKSLHVIAKGFNL